MPSTSTAATAVGSPAATATGYARLNPPHQPQLTPAQQAAQAAITASTSSSKRDGLVPVRTGLAWAPVGGSAGGLDPLFSSASSLWGGAGAGAGFSATLDFGASGGAAGAGGAGAAAGQGGQDLWSTWRSLGLTKLLKKAYNQQQRRGRPAAGASSGAGGSTQAQLQQTQQTVQAALVQMQQALARSQEVLQQQLLLQLQVPPLPPGSEATAGSAAGPELLQLEGPATAGDGASSSALVSALPAGAAGGSRGGDVTTQLLAGSVDSSGLALAAAAAAITKPAVDSSNMDCLARRADQLSFSTGEQDRGRLIKVRCAGMPAVAGPRCSRSRCAGGRCAMFCARSCLCGRSASCQPYDPTTHTTKRRWWSSWWT